MRRTARFVTTTLLSAKALLAAGTPAFAQAASPRSEIGPATIGDLPAHPLLVHIPVVVIPLASVALVVSAAWAAARRKLSWITPLLGVGALISVPLTTQSGEWLEGRVEFTPLVERHEELAEGLLLWIVGLAVWSLLVWGQELRERRRKTEQPSPVLRRLVAIVAVLGAITFSAGSVVQTYRVGESGASAVWTDTASGQ